MSDFDNNEDQGFCEDPDTAPAEPAGKIPFHTRFWMSLRWGIVRKLLPVWAISLVVSLLVILALDGLLPDPATQPSHWGYSTFVLLVLISFISMYLNTALGMGYGVTLIPILILFDYQTIKIIPAVLTTQFLAEFASGLSHQSAGNVDLSKDSPHLKVALVLAGVGIIGGLFAVQLFVKINEFSEYIVNLIIGISVLFVGVTILITMGRRFRFSWRKIIALGLIASFIKGFTGGGYGPIVTGGQVLCGIGGKAAIGVKTVAEGLVCIVLVMGFLATGQVNDLTIAYPLVLGAICSVPFSAYTVRRLGTKRVTTLIATVTIVLGIAIVYKELRILEVF